MSSRSSCITWFALPLLARASMARAVTPFYGSKRGIEGDNHTISFYKRQLSSHTKTYIGVVVGIFGTIVVISAFVCWDLLRRRRASRMREMEEARRPRVPISYDHFPVEDGDGEALQHHSQDVVVGRQPLTIPAGSGSRSSPSHHHVRPSSAASSTIPPASTSPVTYPQPVYAYRHHRPTRSQSSSANSSINGEDAPLTSQGDAPRYEEAVIPPPPAFYSDPNAPTITSRPPPPPGLEDLQRPAELNPSTLPALSRPPTASAPPAYTASN
ncbi:hypothetical protein FRC18_005203 [Serendipita sp. 400]|nr:hypothetical protein FRC18_005203 [Serendipita sp. 400]